jgi:hypothetical protein
VITVYYIDYCLLHNQLFFANRDCVCVCVCVIVTHVHSREKAEMLKYARRQFLKNYLLTLSRHISKLQSKLVAMCLAAGSEAVTNAAAAAIVDATNQVVERAN